MKTHSSNVVNIVTSNLGVVFTRSRKTDDVVFGNFVTIQVVGVVAQRFLDETLHVLLTFVFDHTSVFNSLSPFAISKFNIL